MKCGSTPIYIARPCFARIISHSTISSLVGGAALTNGRRSLLMRCRFGGRSFFCWRCELHFREQNISPLMLRFLRLLIVQFGRANVSPHFAQVTSIGGRLGFILCNTVGV